MACDLSKGMTSLPCKSSYGGIKNVYVMRESDWYNGLFTNNISNPSITYPISQGNLFYDWGGDYTVYKFALKNSANTFTQDMTSSRDNGTTVFTQTLNLFLPKLSSELEFQVKILCYGRPRVFVELNDGTLFMMGNSYGCEATGKSEISGTLDGRSGYTLTIIAAEDQPVWYLVDDAAQSLFNSISAATV